MPVLSELIAEIAPSVSTERSRFTIASVAARAVVPIDRKDVTTAGKPVGIAEMANATPSRNSVIQPTSRAQAEPGTRSEGHRQ